MASSNHTRIVTYGVLLRLRRTNWQQIFSVSEITSECEKFDGQQYDRNEVALALITLQETMSNIKYCNQAGTKHGWLMDRSSNEKITPKQRKRIASQIRTKAVRE